MPEYTVPILAAGADLASSAGGLLQNTASAAQGAAASAGGQLVATYADIDHVVSMIRSHAEHVAGSILHVGGVAVDPDLLVSAVLSPLTWARVEFTAAGAVAQLIAGTVVADGVLAVSLVIVATYQLMDAALDVAAATLDATGGVGSVASDILTGGQVAFETGIATVAAVAGLGVLAGVLVGALGGALIEEGGAALATVAPALAAIAFGQQSPAIFDATRLWINFADNISPVLDALGPLTPLLYGTLLASGRYFGLFHDGTMRLGDPALGLAERVYRGEEAAAYIWDRMYGDRDGGFELNAEGMILPRSVPELWATGYQLTPLGDDRAGIVRIIKNVGPDGDVSYIVIPDATGSFLPVAGTLPNDLTTDLGSLAYQRSEYVEAVFAAMKADGIPTGPGAPPVLMFGHSLGGITSALISSDPRGYNIQDCIVGGAPIGRFAIDPSIRVVALELDGDPMPRLDGARNPSTITTISSATPLVTGEEPGHFVGVYAHQFERHALVAEQHADLWEDPRYAKYFDGDKTPSDKYIYRV